MLNTPGKPNTILSPDPLYTAAAAATNLKVTQDKGYPQEIGILAVANGHIHWHCTRIPLLVMIDISWQLGKWVI